VAPKRLALHFQALLAFANAPFMKKLPRLRTCLLSERRYWGDPESKRPDDGRLCTNIISR